VNSQAVLDSTKQKSEIAETLSAIIARRDEEYGNDYNGVKNDKFRDGGTHPGQRPRLQNIPSLSRGVAEALSMFCYTAGKLPGGSWNLHFPKQDGKPGIDRVVKNCKNESIFWDCVAQQVIAIPIIVFHSWILKVVCVAFYDMQVTYVFAHQLMGGTFAKHPSGNNFKNWALPKFNIVNKAVELLQKGVAFVD
jgi:hypothetical protein